MEDVLETRFRNAVDALSYWLVYPTVPLSAPGWHRRYSELLAEMNEASRQLGVARASQTKVSKSASLNRGRGNDRK
jgi:hypothetical protein